MCNLFHRLEQWYVLGSLLFIMYFIIELNTTLTISLSLLGRLSAATDFFSFTTNCPVPSKALPISWTCGNILVGVFCCLQQLLYLVTTGRRGLLIAENFTFRSIFLTRDRPIYRPIFGFYRYIGIGQNGQFYRPQKVLKKRCCIPHACRQRGIQDSYLQQRQQVRFHKQANKINHGACVGRRSRNKSINGKFLNAWGLLSSRPCYHVQVLFTDKTRLYF